MVFFTPVKKDLSNKNGKRQQGPLQCSDGQHFSADTSKHSGIPKILSLGTAGTHEKFIKVAKFYTT